MTTGDRIKFRRKELGLTVDQVAERLGKNRATIYRYEKGEIEKVPGDILEPLSKILQTTPAYLMGWDTTKINTPIDLSKIDGIMPVPRGKKIPLIGSIACGTPILAEQNIESYIDIAPEDKADFCLRCKGDSMNPRLEDGDIVLIKEQPTVENGQIAAVLIGEEATLKHVYYTGDTLTLIPDNHNYPPMTYTDSELEEIKILGLATGYIRMF